MSCWQTVQDYALRSIGLGERLLPREGFTLCEQVTLIGSGMIWNVYFGVLALLSGFFLATALALAKASTSAVLRKPAEWFILLFRGSPLFIQFFFAYFLFLSLKGSYPIFGPLTSAWAGALVVLFFNTSAYSAEIFYGALRSVPSGDIEVAKAYGLTGWARVPAHRLAHAPAPRLARLHERGDLPLPRHDAGLLFRFSRLAAAWRCALLRQILRRPDLQSVHPLPHSRRFLHAADAGDHHGVRDRQSQAQPSSAARKAQAAEAATQHLSLSLRP